MQKRFAGINCVAQAAILALAFFAPSSTKAAGFNTLSFPVAINVDGERVRSSLFIQFEIERYDVAFEAFASGRLDAFETAFRDFMLALRAGDAAKVAALRPGDSSAQVLEITTRYQGAFAGPQTIKVVGRVRVGDAQLFVWEWPGPKGPMRRGFTVEAAANGSTRVEIVYSGRPLETLIVDVLQQEAVHPREYAPVEPRVRYRYAFPLSAPGKANVHPVLMLFNGQILDVEMFSAAPAKAGETKTGGSGAGTPLAAYRTAYGALRDRNVARFSESYTDKSRTKLSAWFQKMNPEEFNSYYATAMQPRALRFILDADPVALVFYTIGTEKRLRYEYMVKSGEGYKLSNAYSEGFLDDVLGNNALFPTELESFMKNVLAVNKSG